jgi:colicin import membrane protein
MTAEKQIALVGELPEQDQALAVFVEPKGLDPWLEKIKAEALSLVPDLTTKKGRDAIASMAYKVRQSKTALDKIGKELVDKLKEQPKLVDAERKRMRDILDALADEVRKPLDEFEAKEAARIEKHKANVDTLRPAPLDGMTADNIHMLLTCIGSVPVDETWEEFEAEAHRVKAATITVYQEALEKRKQYESEQAELARLRAEAEERAKKDREEQIAREAAERAKREAEQAAAREKAEAEAKAKAEREAAERRELELKLQAEQAERQKLAAEQAQKDAEAARIKAEHDAKAQAEQAARDTEARLKREAEQKAAAESAELAKREADKKHRAKVNNEAAAPFVGIGFTEKQAQDIIKLIVTGKVPHVKIQY